MRAYVLALILLLTACAPLGRQYEVPMDKLTTADGQAIAFTYTAAKPGSPGAILLHQFRRDRHDYDSFAPQLQKAGYNVIAIDVRGHGQSSGSAQNEADFQNIPLDIAAAKNFLAKKGADTKHLLLIGASFTANSIINDAATDKDVVAVIAISPGMDFKGIKPEQGIRDVPATLLIAAEDDPYSASSVRKLAELNPAVSTKIYPR
ncbi:MAG TPA: alpha/beta hydrolase, partial [Candidatus Binatia bacterium]|nr:alpha/beta hydrolase [Candidatus Binatia bacterium]